MKSLVCASALLLALSPAVHAESTFDAARNQMGQRCNDCVIVWGATGPEDTSPGIKTPFNLNGDRSLGGEKGGVFSASAPAAGPAADPKSGDSMQDVASDLLKSRALDALISFEVAKFAMGNPAIAAAVQVTLALWPNPAH